MLKTPLDQWRPKFEEVGQIFGKEKETKEWFKQYDEKASKLHDKIVAKTGDAKFMKMAAYPNAFRVYGDYGYGSVIFNDLKLPAVKGTPTDKPLVQVQKEALIDYNPDYLFVFTTGDGSQRLKEFQEESIWKNMNAVKNNHVFTIKNEDLNKGYFPLGKEMILDEVAEFVLGNNGKTTFTPVKVVFLYIRAINIVFHFFLFPISFIIYSKNAVKKGDVGRWYI